MVIHEPWESFPISYAWINNQRAFNPRPTVSVVGNCYQPKSINKPNWNEMDCARFLHLIGKNCWRLAYGKVYSAIFIFVIICLASLHRWWTRQSFVRNEFMTWMFFTAYKLLINWHATTHPPTNFMCSWLFSQLSLWVFFTEPVNEASPLWIWHSPGSAERWGRHISWWPCRVVKAKCLEHNHRNLLSKRWPRRSMCFEKGSYGDDPLSGEPWKEKKSWH